MAKPEQQKKIDWERVQLLYTSTDDSVKSISERCDVARATIMRKVKRLGWQRPGEIKLQHGLVEDKGPLSNHRHEVFSFNIAHGMPAQMAYTEAGYDCSDAAAKESARRLLENDDIRRRIAEHRAELAAAAKVTQEALLSQLESARLRAIKNNSASGEIQAVMGKARITGHIVSDRRNEKSAIEDVPDDALDAAIAKLQNEVGGNERPAATH